jgi:DNA invertase Pin-like site-specific DNA recombinase
VRVERKPPLTLEQFERAEKLLSQGFSSDEVAESLGRTRSSLNKSLSRFRNGLIKFKPKENEEISQKILDACISGETYKQAGARFGIDKANVYARLARLGYDRELINEERELRAA